MIKLINEAGALALDPQSSMTLAGVEFTDGLRWRESPAKAPLKDGNGKTKHARALRAKRKAERQRKRLARKAAR